MKLWGVIENPDLSLAPSQFFVVTAESSNISSSGSEVNPRRKRKYSWDHVESDSMLQSSIELQLKNPLPLDWEQCLDLESGRMYYMNRNTLKKSYNWPKEQKIDLELNISPLSSSDFERSTKMVGDSMKHIQSSNSMVAAACHKCHLLVMLSKSSPNCPNCKHLHSFPLQQSHPPKAAAAKSFETLSLLN